jgi:radical SAM superfamily enzyme YgiQ (UPF0313 family)
MKIALIHPARKCGDVRELDVFRMPPLGLQTVAALTPADVPVQIVDENYQSVEAADSADAVGIGCLTATAPRAYELADTFRARGVPVVLGGHHPSICPDEAARHADAVVVGQAEGIWPQVVADLKAGSLQPRYESPLVGFPDEPVISRRNLTPYGRYLTPNSVETTRGCPNTCEFCSVRVFFRGKFHRRPVEHVVQEILHLPTRGFIWFVADNFTIDRRYAKRLLEAIVPLRRRWFCQASLSSLSDPELLRLMRRAGCELVFIGFESITREGLEELDKTVNNQRDYGETIRMIHEHGINIEGAFIFGLDSHDESIFDRTVEFGVRHKIDGAQFTILTPLPGTETFRRMHGAGRIFDYNWEHYDCGHAVFRPAKMSPDTLQRGLHYAYHQYYRLPSILRRLIGNANNTRNFLLMNTGFRMTHMDRMDDGTFVRRLHPRRWKGLPTPGPLRPRPTPLPAG